MSKINKTGANVQDAYVTPTIEEVLLKVQMDTLLSISDKQQEGYEDEIEGEW